MEKSLVYGLKCLESLANYDLESHSWKTSQLSLFGDYQEFVGDFPKSGMIRNGVLYRLENLVLPTYESASFALPTPVSREARLGYQRRDNGKKGRQKSLTTVIIDQMGGREKVSGQLNPEYVEWLMGFPIGHTDCGD